MNEEKVKELLRESGLKVTSQRLMVMNILASYPDSHLTAKKFMIWQKRAVRKSGLLRYTGLFRSFWICI